jgi:proteasome accessory factor A
MIERGRADASLILENPVQAAVRWSHDPSLRAKARLLSGKSFTAVEMQSALFENARRFVDDGGAEGIVPAAHDIIEIWGDTLEQLRKGDIESLASRLDWALKRSLLEMSMESRGLDWDSPEIKYLDHIYSSLDATEGLYWNCEASGAVQRVVSSDRIDHFVHHPPEDTRAWTRSMLLRRGGHHISSVDWDSIRFRLRNPASSWPTYRRMELANPLGFTRAETEDTFADPESSLDEILDGLGASESESWYSSTYGGSSGTSSCRSGKWKGDGRRATYPVVEIDPGNLPSNS